MYPSIQGKTRKLKEVAIVGGYNTIHTYKCNTAKMGILYTYADDCVREQPHAMKTPMKGKANHATIGSTNEPPFSCAIFAGIHLICSQHPSN